ncbi:T9SS type A sorting domain-containing protein [Aureispira sp. CCB-E]|uniref:T9SS type A sorting domain-containing protein n=1 Tax=Aureispira sp. CCB-E TaxID=3051121 RepID=UPI0028692904|nr:fibronectin type III domain-containing protein [Aureispira sp. CCB-E]WMX12038.1 fibronectin type III domain-containing protein [Aureispira sp. CCB-E]
MKTIQLILLSFLCSNLIAQQAGSLDPSFGIGGKVVTSITNGLDQAHGVAIQTNGKIVVAGNSSSLITGKDFVCARYNTNGTLDSTFGNGGIVTTDLQIGSEDVAYDLVIQTNGKIILAGSSDNGTKKDAALVRYNTNGSIDSTFGTNGIVISTFVSNQQDEIKVVKIHALTGNIIVGGNTEISSNEAKPIVARYLSTGNLDLTFGVQQLPIGTTLGNTYYLCIEDLEVRPNGKIVAAGWRDIVSSSRYSDFYAARINSNGTMDNTFSADGVMSYDYGGSIDGRDQDRAYSVSIRPDGDILLIGTSHQSLALDKFSLVELDDAGGIKGPKTRKDVGNLYDVAYGFAEDNNGQFILAGSSGYTSKEFTIVRTLESSNYDLDVSFGNGGVVHTSFNNNSISESFDVLVQPADNKIVAVGYTGNDLAIARYLGTDIPQLDSFQLTSPANLATEQSYSTLPLVWTTAFGATSYEIDVDTLPSFATAQTYTSSNTNIGLSGLLSSTKYYWRVRATDGTSWGQYSAVWCFTTNSLDNFNLIAPADLATNQVYVNLVFDWTTAVGASSYEMLIDSSATFASNPQTYTASSSTWTVNNLQPKTEYFWKVRALNGTTAGPWSSTWSFRTEDLNSISKLLQLQLNIYPNPTNTDLYLELPKSLNSSTYRVVGITGEIVKEGRIDQPIIKINLEDILPGMYFLDVDHIVGQPFQIIR